MTVGAPHRPICDFRHAGRPLRGPTDRPTGGSWCGLHMTRVIEHFPHDAISRARCDLPGLSAVAAGKRARDGTHLQYKPRPVPCRRSTTDVVIPGAPTWAVVLGRSARNGPARQGDSESRRVLVITSNTGSRQRWLFWSGRVRRRPAPASTGPFTVVDAAAGFVGLGALLHSELRAPA